MATTNGKVETAILASLCGQILPNQPWADIFKSVQSGIPPHLNQKLKISPQLSALAFAVVRAVDIRDGTENASALLGSLAHKMSVAIDFGVPVTESELTFLREKFGRVARLSDIEGVRDTPDSALAAVTDQGFDMFLTHRGPGGNKKKPHQKTLSQLVAIRHTEIFKEDASPLSRLRRAFCTPLLLHYNPQTENRVLAMGVAEIDRPSNVSFSDFASSVQQAMRDVQDEKEIRVHGVRIDVEKTLALLPPNLVTIGDLLIPDSMGAMAFKNDLWEALATAKGEEINFHGNRILVEETKNFKQIKPVRVNALPLPSNEVNEDFFGRIHHRIQNGCRPNEPFELAGLKILGHETKHHPDNVRKGRLEYIVLEIKPDGLVMLPDDPARFSLHRTGGRVAVIEEVQKSGVQVVWDRFAQDILSHALVRTHVGLTLNGACAPTESIESLGGEGLKSATEQATVHLGIKLQEVTGVSRPGRDKMIYQTVTSAGMAIACGELSL